jgi:hypothetical protein
MTTRYVRLADVLSQKRLSDKIFMELVNELFNYDKEYSFDALYHALKDFKVRFPEIDLAKFKVTDWT